MYRSITRKLAESVDSWNSPPKVQITEGGSRSLHSNKGPRGFWRRWSQDLILRDTGLDHTPQQEGMGSDLSAAIPTAPNTVLVYTGNKDLLNYLFNVCNNYLLNYLMHAMNICWITYLIMFLIFISFLQFTKHSRCFTLNPKSVYPSLASLKFSDFILKQHYWASYWVFLISEYV